MIGQSLSIPGPSVQVQSLKSLAGAENILDPQPESSPSSFLPTPQILPSKSNAHPISEIPPQSGIQYLTNWLVHIVRGYLASIRNFISRIDRFPIHSIGAFIEMLIDSAHLRNSVMLPCIWAHNKDIKHSYFQMIAASDSLTSVHRMTAWKKNCMRRYHSWAKYYFFGILFSHFDEKIIPKNIIFSNYFLVEVRK